MMKPPHDPHQTKVFTAYVKLAQKQKQRPTLGSVAREAGIEGKNPTASVSSVLNDLLARGHVLPFYVDGDVAPPAVPGVKEESSEDPLIAGLLSKRESLEGRKAAIDKQIDAINTLLESL